MSRFIRRALPFVAVAAIVGVACQVPPTKKGTPTTQPPTDIGPGDPGVNVCTLDPVVISGNVCDWIFQRDAGNVTAGGFTTEEFSTGAGSLKAGPIGSAPAEKYIAEYGDADGDTPIMPVDEFESLAYDFLIAGTGTADNSYFRPYLNVYTTFTDPGKFYDCRFDYVPGAASLVDFTTATFDATDVPTKVQPGSGVGAGVCPATLAEMPAGSHLRFFSISVGDTQALDDGLIAYLDNVVLETTAGTTTFDFEA